MDVEGLSLPGHTAVKLAELRAVTGLKTADCCVLLAAEHVRGRVATFDNRLAEAAATRNLETVNR
jgi:predicted nucleic acid-binding protein